ncbi:ubiquitin domain-containing protein UBFD1 [Microplitis demolitor]|uniref:ubiquitin domain-containing protein UBFD1 n=1 Tax=Microplitis demolitor TaxID=69319 RepID=UPI0004CDD0AE|nr:ubiquitin domain-containing protein UBFD1 [Microplitis demolitor]
MDVDTKKADCHENHCGNSTHSEVKLNETPNTVDNNEKLSNEDLPKNKDDQDSEEPNEVIENIEFKVIYNKKKIDVTFPLDGLVIDLKNHLQNIISVPKEMQKVMIKGLAKDQDTLRSLGVTNGAKVMIVGSKLDDVLSVSVPNKQEVQDEAAAASSKEPLTQQKIHRKILDKGVPEDAMPGIINAQDPLPEFPLSGMLNKSGGKVRLTFKLEQDQLWIGTKERTDKISMNSIKNIHSEPIPEFPEYHIMGIQLGTTEASRYWIYWVPAQYIAAIKDAVLGKWCYF